MSTEIPDGCVPFVGPDGPGIMITDMRLTKAEWAAISAGGRLLGPDPLSEAGRPFVPSSTRLPISVRLD